MDSVLHLNQEPKQTYGNILLHKNVLEYVVNTKPGWKLVGLIAAWKASLASFFLLFQEVGSIPRLRNSLSASQFLTRLTLNWSNLKKSNYLLEEDEIFKSSSFCAPSRNADFVPRFYWWKVIWLGRRFLVLEISKVYFYVYILV